MVKWRKVEKSEEKWRKGEKIGENRIKVAKWKVKSFQLNVAEPVLSAVCREQVSPIKRK